MVRARKELVEAADVLSKRDRVMRKIVREVGPPDLRRGRAKYQHFTELARAVCYQQLAGAAARTIHGRFNDLFGLLYGIDPMPTAKELEDRGDAFRPYRSVAAWYCWRAVDTVLPKAP